MNPPSFKKLDTKLKDVVLLQRNSFYDERGVFGKLFNKETFFSLGLPKLEFKETIYSISNKNVIRGMHYQLKPHGTAKVISCLKGSILDVLVGIDKENFGNFESFELSSDNKRTLYIPSNYAHGFKSLEEDTIVVYNCTELYYPNLDKGINFNSFGFDWDIKKPIISKKDRFLPLLKDIKIF